jgi:hypothetical protein
MKYEIRPHHAFTGWVLIFRDGVGIGARTSRAEAEEYIRKQKHLANIQERMITL